MLEPFYKAGRMHPLLHDALKDIESATTGMTDAQLKYHPEGKWCAAEILEHLSLAFELTSKGCEKALAAGKNLGGEPSMKERLIQTVVVGLKYIPPGRKAPERTTPKGIMGGLEAVERIRNGLVTMDEKLTECRAKLDTRGRLLNHPLLGPFTNEQWCIFHYVHTKHHMKQVRALRESQAAAAANA